VLKKTLPGWLLLLVLLVVSTHLAYAAGPPTPTPTPPHPGSGLEPIEISIVVRPNGTWEGEAHLSFVFSSPLSSELEEALDAQVQREAAAILEGRGIHATWEKTLNEPLNEKRVVNYTLFLEGEEAREIVEMALDVGNITERPEVPVALELSGAVREDETLAITLPGNPSTGYSWGVETLDGNTLSQVNDVETHQVSKGLGTPARQVVRLRAMETGQAGLRLAYRRPWQADLPPAVALSIQSDGLDLADACAILSMPLPPLAPSHAFESQGEEQARNRAPQRYDFPTSIQTLPAAFNWCDQYGCTPVKDQGACGSCWAFGTVGPLEARILMAEGATTTLSEQYLLSCNTDGWGCDGGWWAHDYHQDMKPPSESRAGAVLESAFPYRASKVPCEGPYNHPYRISSWHYVGDSHSIPSEDAIKQAIHSHGPVAAAVCVGDAFQDYDGGVFQTNETCADTINHAVVLVGWDDSQQVWILRNSWGTSWGENGYMHIRYETSKVGFSANYITYAPLVASDWVYLPLVKRGTGVVYTLSNGDFEDGRDGSWSEYSSNGWPLILSASGLPTSVSPHGGNWAAWLGGDDDETAILSQYVTIPSNATTLNYWYWSGSEDYCGYDHAYVRFGSTTLKTYNLCTSSNTGGWISQQINVTSWQEQTVELRFVAETDWSLNSNFFLDDVSISTTAAASGLSIPRDLSGAPAVHTTATMGSR